MSAFYDAALARYCDIAELFHDPHGASSTTRRSGGSAGTAAMCTRGCGDGPAGKTAGELPEPSQGGGNAIGRPPGLPVGEVRLVPWQG